MAKVYPENFEVKVGFDKIRDLLKGHCLSSLGCDKVDETEFSSDMQKIRFELSVADEFTRVIAENDNFPTSHYIDLRPALSVIKTEGRFLEVRELFDMKRSMETIGAIIHFFGGKAGERFPTLKKLAGDVTFFPYVNDRIDRILTPYGKIKDQASPELARIRRDMASKQAHLSKRLHAILKEAQNNGLVDPEAVPTIRDGRPVIPMAAGMKRKLSGIVHDESATGKTVYIEPAEVVELNNQIRELEYAEKREIFKILVEFSNDIRPYIPGLTALYDFLGMIDFLRAKGLLARRMKAVYPLVEDKCQVFWFEAVHPLLKFSHEKEKRSVVPLDISLTPEKHILLISGPNAGGKSVCLKTVGLLQYMLQCGLMIPVSETSKAGVFENIFIDIGDEQSIENDLSTYSSHLLNMKFFLKNAGNTTLVLIDEFGTGTEPMLGGAIAESILGRFEQQGAFGVITTHYTNLKHFAASARGIENGAMMYDTQRMEPLFRLETGKPGSSFAFEIARKTGMPETILQEATDKIGKEHIDFDKHLRDILRDKRYWETKRQRIRQLEKDLDETSLRYEADLKKLGDERRSILEEARMEAVKMLAEANKKIENTIKEIRENQADKEKTRTVRGELEVLRSQVADPANNDSEWIERKMDKLKHRKESRRKEKEKDKAQEAANVPDTSGDVSCVSRASTAPSRMSGKLRPGDKVRLEGRDLIGEIIETGEKKVVVAFGQLRSSIDKDKLVLAGSNEARRMAATNKTKANVVRDISERRLNFKAQVDVRGQRAEEALIKIQAFVDEAVMLNVGELRILHGKGNGILKEVIRNYLGSDPVVRSFRDEQVQLGGSGITIVELD